MNAWRHFRHAAIGSLSVTLSCAAVHSDRSGPVVQETCPLVLRAVPVDYPEIAQVLAREAAVIVNVLVNDDGSVHSARVANNDPLFQMEPNPFSRAALAWQFEVVSNRDRRRRSAILTFDLRLVAPETPADGLLPVFVSPCTIRVFARRVRTDERPHIDPAPVVNE